MKIDIDHRERVVIAAALRLLSQQPLCSLADTRALTRLINLLETKRPVLSPTPAPWTEVQPGDIVLHMGTPHEVVHECFLGVQIAPIDAPADDDGEKWPWVPMKELTFPELNRSDLSILQNKNALALVA